MPVTASGIYYPDPRAKSGIAGHMQQMAASIETIAGGSRRRLYIAASETRATASYGLLGTPDRIQNVVVPAGAIVQIDFQALWKSSSVQGQAAIFIGANQLKVQAAGTGVTYGPRVQAAQGVISANFGPLVSIPAGLAAIASSTTASPSDVTTGQALGMVATDYAKMMIDSTAFDINPASGGGGAADAAVVGGPCRVFNLAPATYDISVQFLAPGGTTITAKERTLMVQVIKFS